MVIDSEELYPFESRWHDLGGLRYHYLDEGTGEPVVMVHGNPSWSFSFRELVKGLRDSHRVLVPDHIGCGLSDKPDDASYSYRLKRRVDDLDDWLEALGVRSGVTLLLHDWGGMIGMAWAARHPERVKRLVILNTAAFQLPAGKRFPLALRVSRDLRIGAFLILYFNAFCRAYVRVGCKRRPLPAAVRAGYLRPYDSVAHRIATLRFVQDIPLSEGDPSYALVSEVAAALPRFRDTPMLILWGERDFVFDLSFLDEWMRRFPEAEVHRFRDAGHLVHEDAPEEIIPLLRKFLGASRA